MRKRRAYGYTRTAVAETSYIQLQTIRIKDHCRTNNIRLVDVFEDNGKSGLRTFQNSGFDEMLSRCTKKDNIDAIVVTDLERISRNQDDLLLFKDLLKRKSIELIVLSCPRQVTPEIEFQETIADAISTLSPYTKNK